MKILNIILSGLIICSVIVLSGCANTANGIAADWKSGSQSIANSTGN
jgi:predicted small secreted protein